MKRLRIAFLIVLSFIVFSACGEPQSTENFEKSAVVQTTLQIYADATKELKRAELINFEDYFNALKEAQEG